MLSTRRQPLAALFETANLTFADDQLRIQPLAGDSLLASALRRKNNVALLEEILRNTWGDGTTWSLRETGKTDVPVQDARPEDGALKEAHDDPTVQAVLDIFGGSIQSVQ